MKRTFEEKDIIITRDHVEKYVQEIDAVEHMNDDNFTTLVDKVAERIKDEMECTILTAALQEISENIRNVDVIDISSLGGEKRTLTRRQVYDNFEWVEVTEPQRT